jgi:hypothetical protein
MLEDHLIQGETKSRRIRTIPPPLPHPINPFLLSPNAPAHFTLLYLMEYFLPLERIVAVVSIF